VIQVLLLKSSKKLKQTTKSDSQGKIFGHTTVGWYIVCNGLILYMANVPTFG
jgi:hypothetical protein